MTNMISRNPNISLKLSSLASIGLAILLVQSNAGASPAGEELDFKSTCAASYAMKQVGESAASASIWCGCMERELDLNTRIDYVNSIWLGSMDINSQENRNKAARILNLNPEDIQKKSGPALDRAIQNLVARVREPSTEATARCRASLNYQEK